MRWTRRSTTFTLILLLGLLPRLYLAFAFDGNADQTSYSIVRGILDGGGNVYAETRFYNYSPLWMGVLRSASAVSDASGLPYPAVIRALLTGADLALALLLARLGGAESFARYWLNPGAIAIVGFGGQFETLALIPLVGAALAQRAGKSLRWVFALGALAVLMKHSTVFLVWVVFVYAVGVRRALLWMAATGALFLLSLTPFLPAGAEGIWRNVIAYSSLNNGYGLTALLQRGQVIALLYGVLLLLPVLARRQPLTRTLWLSSLGYLTFVTGFGGHYAMPALAFGSQRRPSGMVAWILGVLVAIVSLPGQGVDHALIAFYIWGAAAVAFLCALVALLLHPRRVPRRNREHQQSHRFDPPHSTPTP